MAMLMIAIKVFGGIGLLAWFMLVCFILGVALDIVPESEFWRRLFMKIAVTFFFTGAIFIVLAVIEQFFT